MSNVNSDESLRLQEVVRRDARLFGKLLRGAALRHPQLAHCKVHVVVEDAVTIRSGGHGGSALPPNCCTAVLHVESELSRTTVLKHIGDKPLRNGIYQGGIYVELQHVFLVASVQCMYDGTYYVIPPEEAAWPPTHGWGNFRGEAAFSRCRDHVLEQVRTFDLRELEAHYLASCAPLRKSLAPIAKAKRPRWIRMVLTPWYWPYWLRRITRLVGVG